MGRGSEESSLRETLAYQGKKAQILTSHTAFTGDVCDIQRERTGTDDLRLRGREYMPLPAPALTATTCQGDSAAVPRKL